MPGKVTKMLAHLGRAGRAVEPDEVDPERLQRGEGGTDFSSQQHGAGGFHGHLDEHRDVEPLALSARLLPMMAALACSRS